MADAGRSTPVRFAGEIQARVRPGPDAGVLWIHGYTLDSSVWDGLWSLLPGWSHFGIDLPGHGASSPLAPVTTLKELGQQLADAAAERQVRHVVGLSLGSMIALEVAICHPEAFETLTLAAPALAGGPVDRDVGLRYIELVDLYHRRGAGPWMTELWMRCPPRTFAYASETLRAQLAAVIDRHAWLELEAHSQSIVALARQAQNARALAGSSARPLFVIGEHELPAFRETAAILRGIRPDANLVELPGAGHLCILHAPQRAAELLAEHWGALTARTIRRRSRSG